MAVNQDPATPEEVVLADTVEEEEDLETIEVKEKDMGIETVEAVAIATADVVDGKTVKLKDRNCVNYSKVK